MAWTLIALGSNALSTILPGLAGFIPIGLFGLLRWTVWLTRRVAASQYHPLPGNYRASTSIIVPVYREDPAVFEQALRSWLANRSTELILVIDETDPQSIAIAKKFRRARLIVTSAPGKRAALVEGIHAASGEIIILADSDTVWEPTVLRRILAPFANPRIGGVGTRQRVLNPSTIWQRVAEIYLSIRYDLEAPAFTRMGRAVSCLSGRTAAYRRSVVLPLLGEFVDEYFLGQRCLSGEDKRLTSLVLRAGYDTYHQDDAVVWSTFAPDYHTFLSQRLRWTRNSYRSDLRGFAEGWIWERRFLAFMLIDRLVSPYALLIGLLYFGAALLAGMWAVAAALATWWLVSRAIKIAPHLRRQPSDLWILPQFIAIQFLVAFIKAYALLTIHRHRWLTRPVEMVNGEVVRTDSGQRHVNRVPIGVRLAGAGLLVAFTLAVGVAFWSIGGFRFDRADTAAPFLYTDVPAAVRAGARTPLRAEYNDRYGNPVQLLWSLDGQFLGSGVAIALPADLAPGRHRWTVHARDAAGNTASESGELTVRGSP